MDTRDRERALALFARRNKQTGAELIRDLENAQRLSKVYGLMTLAECAKRGHAAPSRAMALIGHRVSGPATRAYEHAMRAQFAPLSRPSLWERLKRWWYSR